MLKLKDITTNLPKHNYLMIFKNNDLIFDDFVGDLTEDILSQSIQSLEYLEGNDLSIDLK